MSYPFEPDTEKVLPAPILAATLITVLAAGSTVIGTVLVGGLTLLGQPPGRLRVPWRS